MATNSGTTNINTTLEAAFSFADFSALLTLFGEETTKQFLTTSLSTLDTVLLGIAPVGIMTIIVSAIRVGGSPLMKSVIGRARDSPDDEEKEILSSTSSNVREIWDGNRVVRQTGESKTVPLIYNSKLKSLAAMCDDPRFAMTLSNSLEKSGMLSYVLTSVVPGMMLQFPQQEKQRLPHDISLNLTLNTSTGIPRKRTVSLLVIIGLLIQAAVVVVNAFAVYRWQWVKSGKPIERYAYPIWATGTGAITIGVWLCGWVVESSSEKRLVTGYGDELRIIFMQQKLPTQNIPAYAIEPISTGKKMMYSRRLWPSTLDYDSSSQVNGTWRARQYRLRVTCVAIGTLLTLFGFVGQNIGTRGLHWSAGLLQLGATAAVTILRAVIRRKVGRLVDDKATNAIEELESGFEACHLSTKLIGLELYLASFPITIQTARFKDQYLYTILDIEENEISLGDDDDGKYDTLVKRIIEAQILLTRHVPEVKAVKKAAASCLKAMDEILDLVLPEHEEDAWKDIGAFLCVALNHLGTRAARSTDEDGKRFPKFRLIKAPTRREERLRLVQAVFSSTRYTYRKRLDFDFGIDPDFKLAPRILGHCADDDAEARRQLLSAWVESHRKPQEPSRVHISQALGPTATEAEEPVEFLRVSPIFFGLPLKHGFWNAICQTGRTQEPKEGADTTLQLLWIDRKQIAIDIDDFLVLQIALDIISSFMLGLASSPKFQSGFARHRLNQDELCKSLEDIIERNGVCKRGKNARLAFVPALVSCGILNELPCDSSAKSSDMLR